LRRILSTNERPTNKETLLGVYKYVSLSGVAMIENAESYTRRRPWELTR